MRSQPPFDPEFERQRWAKIAAGEPAITDEQRAKDTGMLFNFWHARFRELESKGIQNEVSGWRHLRLTYVDKRSTL